MVCVFASVLFQEAYAANLVSSAALLWDSLLRFAECSANPAEPLSAEAMVAMLMLVTKYMGSTNDAAKRKLMIRSIRAHLPVPISAEIALRLEGSFCRSSLHVLAPPNATQFAFAIVADAFALARHTSC